MAWYVGSSTSEERVQGRSGGDRFRRSDSMLLAESRRQSPFNPLTPNDPYRDRTAPLTSKVAFYIFIQQISVLDILNMVYTFLFFSLSLQNAVCFIILSYLVPVLFTFYIQVC